MRKRVAIIIKHFPPDSKRISGLSSFAHLLFDNLAQQVELHVFSKFSGLHDNKWSETHSYKLHHIKSPFWLNSGLAANRISPHCVILFSGIHKAFLLYPAFRLLLLLLRNNPVLYYYQCVNIDKPFGLFAKRLLSRFDRLFGASHSVVSYFRKIQPTYSTYIPPGVDLDQINKAPTAPKGEKQRIGYFNHLNKIKGCDIAIDSFLKCQFNNTELLIAGSGKMTDIIREKFNGKSGITFLGSLLDPIPYIKSCDIVLLPFRTDITVLGVSQTAIECLAAGVPVIGSNNEVITEAIRNGQEGLIYSHPEQLAEKIRLLHDNPDLRKQLSTNALLQALNFDIKNTSHKLHQFIEEDTQK